MSEAELNRKFINFEEAIELNKNHPVGFYFERNNGDFDETWFPVNSLWRKNIGKVPLMNYTLANLKHGVWLRSARECPECGGEGAVIVVDDWEQVEDICDTCVGTGKVSES